MAPRQIPNMRGTPNELQDLRESCADDVAQLSDGIETNTNRENYNNDLKASAKLRSVEVYTYDGPGSGQSSTRQADEHK